MSKSKPDSIPSGAVSAYSSLEDSTLAGKEIAQKIQTDLQNTPADVIIVFASSKHDYRKLLETIDHYAQPKLIVGCSSAGEFTNQVQGEGSVSAIALRSDTMSFSVGVGKGISVDVAHAAEEAVQSFRGMQDMSYPYRSALILADALAGYTDSLIDHMNRSTAGIYQFFGGGAGDDAQFNRTHVFVGTEAITDAVVALEILSKKPIGIGVRHGWVPASDPMRVTESNGMKLVSLNSIPAADVVAQYAKTSEQNFDAKNPIPFFLHNVLGIQTIQGYQLRVPLSINEDGSINCASDIPNGATVYFMKTTAESAANAAKDATEDALLQLAGNELSTALVFDCVATRLRTGAGFSDELQAVADAIPQTNFVGCNTYGQVSRVDGQFNGFHNCTAVVCIFPA